MELCKKCNSKHDLQKSCEKKEKEPKKGKKLKKIGPPPPGTPGSVATTGQPSIASQIGFGKSEVIGKSFNEMRKSEQYKTKEPAPASFRELKKAEQYKDKEPVPATFSDLKKREDEMMALEDQVNSLAAHLKDVLKKIQ